MAGPIGTPFVASIEGKKIVNAQPLSRLPLERGVTEGQLQTLLGAEYRLLPFEDIDERVEGPLTCLGQEIALPSGSVDLLFLSQNGYLVVAETKLWRNPESRRKVVAQILDYASQLRRWDYSKLETQWQKQTGRKQRLYDHVHPKDYEEAEWIDLINENLSHGRMTLLIVGDGIRTEARQLAEAVSGHPDFQFRLGLVEIRLYRLDDSRILAIPTTLAQTAEIERAVVRIEKADGASDKVTVKVPEAVDKSRSVLDEEAFLSQLRRFVPAKDKEAAERAARAILPVQRHDGPRRQRIPPSRRLGEEDADRPTFHQ